MAAYPPSAIRADLAALSRPDEAGVRWTPADQWHVTLRFLGSVDGAAAAEAFAGVDAHTATATIGPRITRLGPNVVVAPVDGVEGLAAAVDQAMAPLAPPLDHPEFVGHLTLARLRQPGHCSLLGQPLVGKWTVDEISLVESELDPAGARHRVRATRQLAAR